MSNLTLTNFSRRFGLLSAVAVVGGLALGAAAQAQTASATITGQSGGTQPSDCGYISTTPNHTVRVTEEFTALDLEVVSSGNYSLLIQGNNGFSECIRSHTFNGGAIQSTGALTRGTYQIFVGNFDGARHPFTLEVGP